MFSILIFPTFICLLPLSLKCASTDCPPQNSTLSELNKIDNEKFRADICKFDFGASDLEGFNTILCNYIRSNEDLLMTTGLRKANMKRSKVTNKFFESKPFF